MRIISTIEEVRKYISINSTFKYERFAPHVNRVVRGYIVKLLGRDFFGEISAAYEAAVEAVNQLPPAEKKVIVDEGRIYSEMAEKYWELMVFLQDAVANIAFMNCLSQLQVTMGDAGIRLAVNDNQKTAYQWHIDDMKYQLASDGYGALNSLLEYLDGVVDDFETWKTSDSYSIQKAYFVESAELFNNGYYISNSRMTYLTLRYIMQRIEQFDVRRIMTGPVFDKLKESQKEEYSSKERVLMDSFLIPGIVLLTVAKGIIERAIEVSDIGVQANLYTYYVTLKEPRKKFNNESDRDKMVEQLTVDGNEFLQEARKYIEANPDEFGAIADPDSSMNFRVINKPERKIFGM